MPRCSTDAFCAGKAEPAAWRLREGYVNSAHDFVNGRGRRGTVTRGIWSLNKDRVPFSHPCPPVCRRKMGRRPATETEPRAYIRWINGRAYAELGGWAAWGGRRQEPLRAPGEKFATDQPNTAAIVFGYRLAELRENREAEKKAAAVSVPTSIPSFAGYHLACKQHAVGRRRPSAREIDLQRRRLLHAARFFHTRGLRELREITRGDVAAYMEHLQQEVRSVPSPTGRSTAGLSPATRRKYLGTLSNMLKRAKSEGIIKTNFVADLLERIE